MENEIQGMVSVILPCYNVEDYVERCIHSIQNNGYKNLEMICIDDGSTDKTLDILRKLAEEDKRMVVISQKNGGGVSSARNNGLDIATGQYIAFVDPDDWVHPQYFETMVSAALKQDVSLVQCGVARVHEFGNKFEKIDESYSKKYVYEGVTDTPFRSYVWAKLYSRNMIGKLRMNESFHLGEDSFFVAELIKEKMQMNYVHLDAAMYCYFVAREGSLTKSGKIDEVLLISKTWYDEGIGCEDILARKHFLTECMKKCFSVRYWTMFRPDAKKYRKESNDIMKSAFHDLMKYKVFSAREKIMYGVFVYLPIAYRLYRIKNDPGMQQWEKNERRKYKKK